MTEIDKAQEQEHLRSLAAPGELRSLLLRLWQETRMDWGFVTDRLSRTFRKQRQLGSNERRLLAETLYNMVRHKRRIDFALGEGGLEVVGSAPDLERLLVCLVLEHGLDREEASQLAPGLKWAAILGADDKLAAIRDSKERIATRHSLPDFLVDRLVSDLGAKSAESLAASLNCRAPMTIRTNLLKSSREELQSALRKEGIDSRVGKYAPACLQVETRTNLFSLQAFRDGLFEAQDQGSQLISELVAPPPKARIVDYCAGAGGKTLSLAAALENRGKILASDVDKRKLTELRRRAKRAGANNIQVVELNPEEGAAFPKPFEKMLGQAKRVLVDAPCSGFGALRRNPESRWRMMPADLEKFPRMQREIAARAMELVAPGGRLVYATCTLLKAENEAVVEELVKGRDDLEILSPRQIFGAERGDELCDESGRFMETRPDRHDCDGFFAAVIRRR